MIRTGEVWLANCDHASCQEHIRMDSKYELETALKLMGWKINGQKIYCNAHAQSEKPVKLENTEEEIIYVHDPALCEGQICVIHHLTDHLMRSFPQHWRSDRGLMERICTHGIGHPDPDQWQYMRKQMGSRKAHAEFVHGCDGCCRKKVSK